MQVDERSLYRHIGEQIRRRREALGMRQVELARGAEVLRTSVNNIEAGRQNASLPVVYKLCAVLGMEIGEVLLPVAEVTGPSPPRALPKILREDLPPKAAEYLRHALEADRGDSAG